jgi:CheY-like chemotaxis protein
MSTSTRWRFLIVEDNKDIVNQLTEIATTCVDEPDTVSVRICNKFSDAVELLSSEHFDLAILDLKDDGDPWFGNEDEPAGLKIFEVLKKTRFLPVIFYTAFAFKVKNLQTSFVRVLRKSEDDIIKVREEIRKVMATRLPSLARRIEEVQRSYMWDFVSSHWQSFPGTAQQADIAYLLARRLAIAMQAAAGELASNVGGAQETPANAAKAHPMAMYVVPPMGPHPMAGDLVSDGTKEEPFFWVILTPSCDFAQRKMSHITLARCEKLSDRDEFKNWSEKKDEPSRTKLEQLIEDKRGDRFKFLPGTFFVPDLVVDFQQLRSVEVDSFKQFKAVATLDSPFAESLVARFLRYFNRLGTPDIDKAIVMNRFQSLAPSTLVQGNGGTLENV